MKNLLIGIAVGLLIGGFIAYWYCEKDKENQKSFTESVGKTFKISFDSSELKKKKGTDTISYEKAQRMCAEFLNMVKKSTTNPKDPNYKLINWPASPTDTLKGWIVDAKKLKNIIINQQDGGKKDICDNIFIELGYDASDSSTTLIFTGLNSSMTGSVMKDKKIHLKKDAQIWKVDAAKSINGILEYVDPCNPRCPE